MGPTGRRGDGETAVCQPQQVAEVDCEGPGARTILAVIEFEPSEDSALAVASSASPKPVLSLGRWLRWSRECDAVGQSKYVR